MVLASFQIEDKLKRARFFQETFLLADFSIEVVLGMPFLTLSNADIQFARKNSPGDENVEAFVVHVTSLNLNSMPIHPA